MGSVLAKDFLTSDAKSRVTLVDIDQKQLKKAQDFIKNKRLTAVQMDIEDEGRRHEVHRGIDVALSALLHRHSLMALEEALKTGIHFVDLAGEFALQRFKYNGDAKKKGLTLLSGMGVSPGITNVCVGRAVQMLDETKKALIYVGGNPLHPRPPLKYRIVYAVDSLLNFYERRVPILENGEVKDVPPLSGMEPISFGPPFQEMECFYTDGLSSLLHTMEGKVKEELWEKTIRHKGHSEKVKTLISCGLFSRRSVAVGDQKIVPRDVLEVLLDSRIKLGRGIDATLMRIIVSGKKSGKPKTHVFEMIDLFDSKKDFTSMAKTTCFPASIAAQMIAAGRIKKRGSLFPEQVFQGSLYKPFIEELEKRGVVLTHRISG
jgi:lysine 6-dehydrogenase